MRFRHMVMVGVLAAVPLFPLSAQRFWRTADDEGQIGLEVAKVFFKSPNSVAFTSFVFTADGRFPVNKQLSITVGLPFSTVGSTGEFAQPRSNALGNPWIGADVVIAPDAVLEGGIRAGLSSDDFSHLDAQDFGAYADFQRFEAWEPNTTSARAMIHVGHVVDEGTFVTGLVGGTYIFSNNGYASTTLADYAVRLGIAESGILTSLMASGISDLGHNGSEGSLDQNTDLQLAIRVEGSHGKVRPFAEVGTFTRSTIRDFAKVLVSVGASVKY